MWVRDRASAGRGMKRDKTISHRLAINPFLATVEWRSNLDFCSLRSGAGDGRVGIDAVKTGLG